MTRIGFYVINTITGSHRKCNQNSKRWKIKFWIYFLSSLDMKWLQVRVHSFIFNQEQIIKITLKIGNYGCLDM